MLLKKILFVSAVFVVSYSACYAQDVVLDMEVEDQYEDSHGPNMRHYGHFFMGMGLVTNLEEQTGARIDVLSSPDYMFGYRYKLKLLSFYALGFEAHLKGTRYGLSGDEDNPQDINNPLTLPLDEKRHFLRNNAAGIGVYQRINIGRRGNTLGNYIDMGVEGHWNYSVKEVLVFKGNSDYAAASDSRSVYKKLNYYNDFSYGLNARLGIGKIAIYAGYRISDYFNDKYIIPELPRLTAGLQVVLR